MSQDYKDSWRQDHTKDGLLMLITGFVMIVITGLVLKRELNPEWAKYQREFTHVVREKMGDDAAEKTPGAKMPPFGTLGMAPFGAVQQIWLPDLKVTDRCISCHLGMQYGPDFAKKNLKKEHHLYQSHPNPIIGIARDKGGNVVMDENGEPKPAGLVDIHKIEDYGCTTCHMGQGVATNVWEAHVLDDAHGHKPRWLYPVLGKHLAEEYKFEDPETLPMSQLQCNTCHRRDVRTEGAPYINRAKEIIWNKEQPCLTCHIIDGVGGTIGPDLTYEGDKSHEAYDTGSDKPFVPIADLKERKRVADEQIARREKFTKAGLPISAFSWQILHFEDPAALSKGSTMPKMPLSNRDIRALSLYVMSLKKMKLPLAYMPKPNGDLVQFKTFEEMGSGADASMGASGGEVEEAAAPENVDPVAAGEALFAARGCAACHDLATEGRVALPGPGLKGVVDRRGEEWLKKWMADPAGMMQTDDVAKALLAEYGLPMPAPTPPFTPDELDHLVAFFREKVQ